MFSCQFKGSVTRSCTRNSWFRFRESVIHHTCHILVRVRRSLEVRQLQFRNLSDQKLYLSRVTQYHFQPICVLRIMYRCSHSVLLVCFSHCYCGLHATEISVPAGSGSIICLSHSIAIYSRWTRAIFRFFCASTSSTNQQVENYHVTTPLVLFRSFELSTPDVYDSVKTPLVCNCELVSFEFFSWFVQIIRVCGRALSGNFNWTRLVKKQVRRE